MTALSAHLSLPLVAIPSTSHRRVSDADFFGNSARMASTRTGGVAGFLDRALCSAFLVFTSSEEQ
ncbi:hypothetical protein L1277_000332 [Okibacterium sp. HSC-33S16]|uniref:hypothetical protein n=1 Tax=Okibacterium sp. HSC-33S16 TaxID=2910965 RepID=UPI00209DFE50|nr:hypothetical protein [Okibacterium sp. HSC-33S16]MCP2030268.1 hypothetical protein [Okibacterium sp. HSC-33S16]